VSPFRLQPASRLPCNDVSAYVRSKRIALAHEIGPKKKIYLDTKYWVLLRDVRLGRPKSSSLAELLARVEVLVRDGHALCPLNADIFFEVFKQNDPATLTASVELIDDLSSGISLIPMTERLPLEVFHFIETSRRGAAAVFAMDELVSTKAAYVIGFVTPDHYELPDEQNVTIQKAFADHMWGLKLSDYLNTMGADKAAAREPSFPDISAQLNEGKLRSIHEHKSFKSLFLSEVRGVLDVYEPELADLIHFIFERDTGNQLDNHVKLQDDSGRLIANVVYDAFRLNRVTNQFPTIRVGAGLHAALRWNGDRKYKANDLFDFRHAEAALPYGDYFLTENSLRQLLQDGNLKFQELFPCKVCSEPSEALSELESIDA